MLSEKFSFEDAKVGELLFNMHHDFKRANGYSELEITRSAACWKRDADRGSVETHKARLHKAGFEHSELWFQCFNWFTGGIKSRGRCMIDFGNFYSLIAKNHLSHWLETLPAQIANWQREQQHGLFKRGPTRWNFCLKLNRIVWIYCIA